MKSETRVQILLAGIAFISGYFLNPLITRQLESDKLTYGKRIEGYMLYAEGFGLQRKYEFLLKCKATPSDRDCPTPEKIDNLIYETNQEKNEKYIKARLSIALLSDSTVAKSLADYARENIIKGIKCDDDAKVMKDVAVYQAMRDELHRDDDRIDAKTMAMVIQGCNL